MDKILDEKVKTEVFLTTIDNPFDPSIQWDEWKRFDEHKEYRMAEYLVRIINTLIN